ncbi:hypothetical protein NQ314_014118 [Rhamnusium bicolor]|uniref:Uncharacterized protein n=1 Tax=Rhamnusium bicolor TaxID=1586634 RepID=A0AAV8X3C6_9CUCU|nr:hypothetical protein NQ314_014118 [Rhamnusium bicolor]
MERLAAFMGHTKKTHEAYYRLPQDIYQTAKVSKMLLAINKGKCAHYKDKIDSEEKPNTKPEKMASISLELAEKMLIKFDGTKSKLFEFIDNCDKAYSLVKSEYKPVLFAIIETKLTDNARSVVRNRSFESWESLKNHLLDIYSERRTIGQWQLELNSCKQNPGESIYQSLSQEAWNACVDLLKNEAMNVFTTGLQKEISILVKSQKTDTLEKAIAIALNDEQELESKF